MYVGGEITIVSDSHPLVLYNIPNNNSIEEYYQIIHYSLLNFNWESKCKLFSASEAFLTSS